MMRLINAWRRWQRGASAVRCWCSGLMGPMCHRVLRRSGAPSSQARQRARRAQWRHEWYEAKGFRLYLLDGDRIVHVLSWHQVQTEGDLGEALQQIKKAGLIPEDTVRLCVIGDGAEWIWKHVQALFPQACQVLDYYIVQSISQGGQSTIQRPVAGLGVGWKRP